MVSHHGLTFKKTNNFVKAYQSLQNLCDRKPLCFVYISEIIVGSFFVFTVSIIQIPPKKGSSKWILCAQLSLKKLMQK